MNQLHFVQIDEENTLIKFVTYYLYTDTYKQSLLLFARLNKRQLCNLLFTYEVLRSLQRHYYLPTRHEDTIDTHMFSSHSHNTHTLPTPNLCTRKSANQEQLTHKEDQHTLGYTEIQSIQSYSPVVHATKHTKKTIRSCSCLFYLQSQPNAVVRCLNLAP